MAASSTTLIPSNSTDALFRAWGSVVAAKLAAVGLVQTGDSGQINWATVLAPVAGSTAAGYEIWRFADALQATAPVFVKVEYGSGGAATGPSLWFTFGSGSNGSGTLTGIASARMQTAASLTATAVQWWFSGDTNRFAIANTASAQAGCMVFCFERSVDSSGAATGEAVLIIFKNGSTWNQVAWNCVTGPCSAVEITLAVLVPEAAPFGTWGTQLAVFPVYHTKGIFFNPGLSVHAYFQATMAGGSAVSFTVYGATRSYMPLGSPHPILATSRSGVPAALAAMIRYD